MNSVEGGTAGWLDLSIRQRLLSHRPVSAVSAAPADALAPATGALECLPLVCVQVAEALAALGPGVNLEHVAGLLGVESGDEALHAALGALEPRGLVRSDAQGCVWMVPALRHAWPDPLGLGPSLASRARTWTSAELDAPARALGMSASRETGSRHVMIVEYLSDPVQVHQVVDQAPEKVRVGLKRLARPSWRSTGGPGPHMPLRLHVPPTQASMTWGLERALALRVPRAAGSIQLPTEVTLALRGPRWRAPFDPDEPTPALRSITSRHVEQQAAAAGWAFVEEAELVFAECARAPLALVAAGAVGQRELGRLAKATSVPVHVVRLALESGRAAGLLERASGRVSVSQGYARWTKRTSAERLWELHRAWWGLGLTPTGSCEGQDLTRATLSDEPDCDGCRRARHDMIAAAAGLPREMAVAEPQDLASLVAWHWPWRETLPIQETPLACVVQEAEDLGVLAAGALTGFGAALLADDPAAHTAHAHALLPATESRARFDTDLTAIVAGTPTHALTAFLNTLADPDASQAATTWRFTADSVRRARDAGWSTSRLVRTLKQISDGALPPCLTALIEHSEKAHGDVTVTAAGCVVQSEAKILIEVTRHPALAELGLEPIAPTILVSDKSAADVLTALRRAGYAPTARARGGVVSIAPTAEPTRRSTVTRPLRTPRTPQPARPAPFGEAWATRAPGITPVLTEHCRRLTAPEVDLLADAINTGSPTTIDYEAADHTRTLRTISQIQHDPPNFLVAWCHLRRDERKFKLDRIRAVHPANDTP